MSSLWIAALPGFAALVSASLAIYCWRRSDVLAAREFSIFMLTVLIWTSFHTLQMLSLEPAPRFTFGKLSYLGIAPLPVAFLAFTLRWVHRDHWLRPLTLTGLLAIPALTLGLALTEPAHGLLWSEIAFAGQPHPNLVLEHGPWWDLVHIPYSYLLYLASGALLIAHAVGPSRQQRSQSLMLIGAVLLPFAVNLLYTVSGLTLVGLDPTPSAIALSGVIIGVALFGTGLLRETPLSYYTVFFHSSDGIILTDTAGRVLDANPAALGEQTLLDVRREPLDRAFPSLAAALDDHSGDATRPVRYQCQRNPGRTFEARRHTLHTRAGRAAGRALLVRDATNEVAMRRTLEHQAANDPLTGLPNRRTFEREAAEALARNATLGPTGDLTLLYLDLDGFKKVNDDHGHNAGDVVLRAVAQRLQGALREHDHIARLGGDEFAVLIQIGPGTTPHRIAERLRATLAAPIGYRGVEHTVRTSIGVARVQDFAEPPTLEQLLERADEAMYRDKRDREAVH